LVGVLAAAVLCAAASAQAAAPVFVTNESSSNVSAFNVLASGALASAGAPVSVSEQPKGAVVSPDGSRLYVALLSNAVAAFSIGPGATLTAIPGSPFATGGSGGAVSLAMTPDGAHLYATSFGGSVSVFNVDATGALALVGSPTAAAGPVEPLAVTATGYLYVATTSGTIYAFKIAPDGSLSALAGSPYSPGGFLTGMALAPSQSELFVTDNGGGGHIEAFMIGAGGALTAVSGSPFSSGSASRPRGAAVSPDGSRLYVAEDLTNNVTAMAISSAGALSEIAGSPFAEGGTSSIGVAVNAAGSELFVSNTKSNDLSALAIEPGGGLMAIAGSPFSTRGTGPFLQSVAVAPDQGPHAALSVGARPAGAATTFNASGSSDSDGTVSRYDWAFGDGATLSNGGPTPTHVYATPGTYTATVTTTDDGGCSTAVVFTGQSLLCNGSPSAVARTTLGVSVPKLLGLGPLAPMITALHQTATRWREGGAPARISRRARGLPIGTRFTFALNESATVRFDFTQRVAGRRVGKRCVAGTRGKARRTRCTRTVSAASFSFAGHAGTNKVVFQGRIPRSTKLKPGPYTLVVTATNSLGVHSAPARLRFTTVR
jgi:DNA-binding beta-propeller fold protein YncE